MIVIGHPLWLSRVPYFCKTMQWNENEITLELTLEKAKEYRVCLVYRRMRVMRAIDEMGPISSDECGRQTRNEFGISV